MRYKNKVIHRLFANKGKKFKNAEEFRSCLIIMELEELRREIADKREHLIRYILSKYAESQELRDIILSYKKPIDKGQIIRIIDNNLYSILDDILDIETKNK